MTTAAGVIIGDEILTGKFADQNGPYLIKRLRELGVDLLRLATIRDGIESIATEVRQASALADVVFTSGGVGPTHDDLTLAGVAAAFDLPLVRSQPLVDLIVQFGLPVNDASMQMATVPRGTELLVHEASRFPVLRCRNVYVLPGVPLLFERKFESIAARFTAEPLTTARIVTPTDETHIAALLRQVAQDHPSVAIGSYPRYGRGGVRVIVTLEGRDAPAVRAAEIALRKDLEVVESVDDGPMS